MARPMRRQDIGYRTKAFTDPNGGANYPLANIPRELWRQFRARCRHFQHPDGSKGISLRARILTLIQQDVESSKEPTA